MDLELATAGTLLRQARKRAGLSQAELAARAGVTQSVISAYESGHRQPAIPALGRLIEATGFELTLGLRRQPGRLSQLSGPVGRRVRRHRGDLIARRRLMGFRICACSAAWPAARTAATVTWTCSPTFLPG